MYSISKLTSWCFSNYPQIYPNRDGHQILRECGQNSDQKTRLLKVQLILPFLHKSVWTKLYLIFDSLALTCKNWTVHGVSHSTFFCSRPLQSEGTQIKQIYSGQMYTMFTMRKLCLCLLKPNSFQMRLSIYFYPNAMEKKPGLIKGGLISESFLLWLKSQKKVPNH